MNTTLKIAAILSLQAASLFVFASDQSVCDDLHITPEQFEAIKEDSKKNDTPIPGSGVHVKPLSQFKEKTDMKNITIKNMNEMKKNGFILKNSPDLEILLNFKTTSENAFKNEKNSELKKTFSEINTAWQVTSFPVQGVEILGIAPAGNYSNGKGWTGFIAYFDKKDIGTCYYIENNLEYSHGAATFVAEYVHKNVNDKITTTQISGEPKSGFLYDVNWYDDNFFHEMRCASKTLDKEKISLMIELAKTIDKN